MGNKTLQRKDFLKTLMGKNKQLDNTTVENPSGNGDDPLFEKYSRKTIGNRFYSQEMVQPDANGSLGLRPATLTAGLAPYTGPWTEEEALHFIRKTTYGAKKSLFDSIFPMTVSNAVDSMLVANMNASTSPSQFPLVWYNFDVYGDLPGVTQGLTWVNNYLQSTETGIDNLRTISNTNWQIGLAIADNTIREKMTQFWYHFIPVNSFDLAEARDAGTCTNTGIMCYDYMNIFRTNALGNFQTLIKAVSKSPAMLVYLGNQYSTAATPNENFARELLELFMMGKTPVQNYTEEDIIAASKILSGWRVQEFYGVPSFNVHFDASYHNQADKTFSSFFGNTTIPNQAGANGANEFDIFFNMLFQHQGLTIAKYICRRLYRYFVYYDIDANIEANIITPLANALVTGNWEMLPVLKLLFKSQHFFDMANRGVMIKSPFDIMFGSIRTFKMNTTPPPAGDVVRKQYEFWNYLHTVTHLKLDQGIMLVPNVSGWKAFYQAPSYYQNWINSNSVQKRQEALSNIAVYQYAFAGDIVFGIDHIDFVRQFPLATIQEPNLLISAITKFMFTQPLSATFIATLKNQTLLGNLTEDHYWTDAWNIYNANPTNTTNENIVKERLRSMVTTLILLAEYQLM
jgi:uncharacterized protein (DUF1800 family)